jgi:hypothetical protein
MKIAREVQDTSPERWAGWHMLTVAEDGFSMLNEYGCRQYGLDREDIRAFADDVNDRDEPGSLHPRAPISAMPRRFFREHENLCDASVLDDFKVHIAQFLAANRDIVRAERILVDFHVSAEPVPRRYIDATEEVFRRDGHGGAIEQVVIFT